MCVNKMNEKSDLSFTYLWAWPPAPRRSPLGTLQGWGSCAQNKGPPVAFRAKAGQ